MASFTFGDPGINPNTGPSPFQEFLGVATLGANTFLANQAISSSQPSSVQVLPNGQIVATGGGAAVPASLFSGLSGGTSGISAIWLFVFGALLFVLLLKK